MKGSDASVSPLVVHIVFRFDYGGLENGVVNVINGLADAPLRHAVIALSEATDFAKRLREDVEVFSIGKRPGKDFGAYFRLYKLLRKMRPTIVHTRNVGTIDCAFVAFLARVPVRIHGEHGWDIFDPDGKNRKYRFLRRIISPFVQTFVTVSRDLQRWLTEVVGIRASKVKHICNGVDTNRFKPRSHNAELEQSGDIMVGSVTRFSAIKDPLNLVDAFIDLRLKDYSLRLLMVGDGELLASAKTILRESGMDEVACLPGSRDDIPDQLRTMDIFVLCSLREGISNTVLEAMASGLPVIASDTGGNPELIEAGANGELVPPGHRQALAEAIRDYVQEPQRRRRHGRASRDRVMSLFSIELMIVKYRALYLNALGMQETG
jgi:sugar transferase (PEP-CTERM/EpsH1 system associated)